MRLDIELTPELKLEGAMRELMRAIQDARKAEGLHPHDGIGLFVDEQTGLLVEAFQTELMRTVGARSVTVATEGLDREIVADGMTYRFGIEIV
jgi:isoleucyl-tRNA synthetase